MQARTSGARESLKTTHLADLLEEGRAGDDVLVDAAREGRRRVAFAVGIVLVARRPRRRRVRARAAPARRRRRRRRRRDERGDVALGDEVVLVLVLKVAQNDGGAVEVVEEDVACSRARTESAPRSSDGPLRHREQERTSRLEDDLLRTWVKLVEDLGVRALERRQLDDPAGRVGIRS